MELINKVKKVLMSEKFSEEELRLLDSVDAGADRISGFIISERFGKMKITDRQDWIWGIFEKKLKPDERRNVLMILAVTPEEFLLHQDEDEADTEVKSGKVRQNGRAVSTQRSRQQKVKIAVTVRKKSSGNNKKVVHRVTGKKVATRK